MGYLIAAVCLAASAAVVYALVKLYLRIVEKG